MRPVSISAIVMLAALSFPVYAASDSSELPNPFTDRSAISPNTINAEKGAGDFGNSVPNLAIQPADNDPSVQPNGQSTAAVPSGDTFYQAAKKDTDRQ
jgi:hypothetical protein